MEEAATEMPAEAQQASAPAPHEGDVQASAPEENAAPAAPASVLTGEDAPPGAQQVAPSAAHEGEAQGAAAEEGVSRAAAASIAIPEPSEGTVAEGSAAPNGEEVLVSLAGVEAPLEQAEVGETPEAAPASPQVAPELAT